MVLFLKVLLIGILCLLIAIALFVGICLLEGWIILGVLVLFSIHVTNAWLVAFLIGLAITIMVNLLLS